jgi:hypothetical protein
MRDLTPLWELEESVYPFKGSDAASQLVAQRVVAVGSSKKQEGREYTGLGSNSQGWRARRHLNSVVRKRRVHLESVPASCIDRYARRTNKR